MVAFVLEDEAVARRFVTRLLKSKGYEVIAPTSSEEVPLELNHLLEVGRSPERILLDRNVWRGTWKQFSAYIRAAYSHGCRVICISSERDSCLEMAEELGCEITICSKPFTLEELEAAIA